MAYVRTRLGRWFCEERGTKRRASDSTIVLLHGLLFDSGMWKAQVEPLAALGRVVMFDLPGHGKSTELPPPFSLEDNTDALMDAFSECAIDRAVIAGLSWGGMLAMRAAIRHPSRVAAMALLDTSAEPEERAKVVKYRLFISFAKRYGLPMWFVQSQLANVMFSEETLRERPELLERFARHTNGFSRDGIARAAKAVVVKRVSVADKLGTIKAPTLVMCGREDRGTSPKYSEQLAASIAGAKLVWIDHAGHMSALERPEAVNAELVPFVRENI
jgi:pimeloyl-ACP methyl ester carboxylesterase